MYSVIFLCDELFKFVKEQGFKESTLVYMYNFYYFINDFTLNCYENYRKRKDYRHAYMQQLANRVNFSRNYGNVDGQVSIAYRYS